MFKYLVLLLSFTSIFSQTINLTIKDKQEIAIPISNVLFKEKTSNVTLEFCKINNGNGSYFFKKNYKTVIITVQSTGYNSSEYEIQNPEKNSVFNFNVVLTKSEIKQLEEVIIKSPDRPYIVKKDTVVFDVNKYRDGSERKVEDLIKKLPGIEIDQSGIIKYKGKQLETVTLDGDNLFSSNYTLGTKNINIDMVEQIEAIENYTNNKLLKGIESDGKVALNLKLKKGKSDFSGNFENGLGLKNDLKTAYYSNSYVMQISSRVKSFANLNMNNIGRSDANFYEKQNSKSLDKKSEDDFKTKKVLSEDLFNPDLDPIRYNRNSQFFSSLNNLYKISKSITFKSNFNFIDDKINSEQNVNTKNFVNNTIFETNDKFSFIKKPKVFTAEFEIKINTSKSTLLEIFSKQYSENTKLFSTYTKNNEIGFNNINETKNYFSLNKLVHTWKISTNKALQGNFYYAFNKIPQKFNSVSQVDLVNQESKYIKKTFLANYNLIGKFKEMNYTIQIGSNLERTPYNSLNNLNTINNTIFSNKSFYNHSRIKYNIKKLTLVPNISFTNYNLKLNNFIPSGLILSNTFVVEPSLDLIYKTGKKSNVTASVSNTQKPISDEYIFANTVFVNNRNLILNNPSFDYQKTSLYSLGYFYNDLLTNTTLNISSRFEKSNGQYLQDLSVNEDFSVIKNIFYAEKNSISNASLRFTRFIEILSSSIIYKSNFTHSEYPNLLNSNDIRINSNQILQNTFEIRTGFTTKINFENVFTHNSITSKSIIKNNVSSIQNSFKIRYKINKKFNSSIKSELYFPDLEKTSNNYNFIDLEFKYKFSDKLNFILIANNLLNIKNFNQSQNNDFSSFTSQTNLTQRFVLLNAEFNF